MAWIVTADWHLRSSRPRCRLDENWIDTQRKVLKQVSDMAKEKQASVIVIGDIFHSTNETTNEVLGLAQDFAYNLSLDEHSMYILAGNHDLPAHNLENIHRSAFQNLLNSKNVYHLRTMQMFAGEQVSAADFGDVDKEGCQVVFKHILCFPEDKQIPPGADATRPSELFRLLPDARYIFTGDYHQAFMYQKGGRTLLNPGCLIRQAADLIDYKPSVMVVSMQGDKLVMEPHPIEDFGELVTDAYLEKEERRNSRIEAFVERIKRNGDLSFDFIDNVKLGISMNKLDEGVKNTVMELIDYE